MGKTAIVVDGHEILRLGMRQLLRSDLGYSLVLDAGTCGDAVAFSEQAPDVDLVVVDLKVADLNGEGVSVLRRTFPSSKFVAMGAAGNRAAIIDALSAGADGYISKSSERKEIAEGLDQIAAGRMVVRSHVENPRFALMHRERGDSGVRLAAALSRLTPRQRDVLNELACGRSTKEIAHALKLSESTVKIHLVGLYRQLGVQSRTQAVLSLRRMQAGGIIQPTKV